MAHRPPHLQPLPLLSSCHRSPEPSPPAMHVRPSLTPRATHRVLHRPLHHPGAQIGVAGDVDAVKAQVGAVQQHALPVAAVQPAHQLRIVVHGGRKEGVAAGGAPQGLRVPDAAPRAADALRRSQRGDGQTLKDEEKQLVGQQPLDQGQLALRGGASGAAGYS